MNGGSQGTSEDIDNADEWGCIPLDGDSSIDFVIPEAGSRDVESAVSLLHNDAVGDELEITVGIGDVFEDLDRGYCTSSQIWLVQTWASLTL